jgi:hypothetical protein
VIGLSGLALQPASVPFAVETTGHLFIDHRHSVYRPYDDGTGMVRIVKRRPLFYDPCVHGFIGSGGGRTRRRSHPRTQAVHRGRVASPLIFCPVFAPMLSPCAFAPLVVGVRPLATGFPAISNGATRATIIIAHYRYTVCFLFTGITAP